MSNGLNTSEPRFAFRNEAAWDRAMRIVLGLGMLAVGLWGPVGEVTAAGLKVFAWVPLLTGIMGWCPFYSLFRFRTGAL